MTTSCTPRPSLPHDHQHLKSMAGSGGSPAAATRKLTLISPAATAAAAAVPDAVARQHEHFVGPNQCCSAVVQPVDAPVAAVWSVVRRFDRPQTYKHFVRSCDVITGTGEVGTVREVHVVSGLPAISSRERLEILDDERHVISFSVVGGEHRLKNYKSVTTLHPVTKSTKSPDHYGLNVKEEYIAKSPDHYGLNVKEEQITKITKSPDHYGFDVKEDLERTVVVESYVVDVPPGNTREETRIFVDTIVRCNLQSLARTAEDLVKGV